MQMKFFFFEQANNFPVINAYFLLYLLLELRQMKAVLRNSWRSIPNIVRKEILYISVLDISFLNKLS